MAHAKAQDLTDLNYLLTELRAIPSLKEKSFGCFYHKSKGVLHFHVKDSYRFAHVFDGNSWQEIELKEGLSEKLQQKRFKEIRKLLPINDSSGT